MKRRHIAILSLVGLILLAGVGIKGYGWWLEHKLERYKTELAARGEKLTVAALMADHRLPEHNRASRFNRATALVYRDGVARTNPPSTMRLVARAGR